MAISGFRLNEKYLSQIPALQLLINQGFEYLPPDQALKARGERLGNLLLEEILRQQLKKYNRMQNLLTSQWRFSLQCRSIDTSFIEWSEKRSDISTRYARNPPDPLRLIHPTQNNNSLIGQHRIPLPQAKTNPRESSPC